MVFDDSGSREQWGWKHQHDIEGLVDVMFNRLHTIHSKSTQVSQVN